MSELLEVQDNDPAWMDGSMNAEFSSVMAFLGDDLTMQTVSRVGVDMEWPDPVIEGGGIGAAIDCFANADSPALLFVDVADCVEPMDDISALADVCNPDTRVIAIGSVNDIGLYRALIDCGVVDYLVKPVMPGDLASAANNATKEDVSPEQIEDENRLFVVTGTKGGIGVSAIAASLAWQVSEKSGQGTALVDLDLAFGTTALTMDVEPGNGLTEILAEPDRIDPLFLERVGVPVGKNLSLFATEMPLSNVAPLQAAAVNVLFEEMLSTRSRVIADIPANILVAEPQLMGEADQIVLVTDLSLSGMRDTLRFKKLVEEITSADKICLVANASRPSPNDTLPKGEFEKAVGLKFSCEVPFDVRGTDQIANRGQVKGKAGRALEKLADHLMCPGDNVGGHKSSMESKHVFGAAAKKFSALFGGGKK
ncbi:MAG: hypothetical protein HN658_05325 [Rhodospirillales bacterium]|jgi:pilus assembly protein CpaE|nr:hypothetical protein [Rhodospirillales bacterium]MBT5113397.1 hypothetical protein [Rhodospirillales bacterium]MBT5672223.1 hypothetical protein [Rhodospirillales bacterium]MBT6187176.1 hypothetical protein [Rhodospirillales bacterium]MBT6742978.1 hypothetical protein [Rhodospirillales bacterium]